MSNQAYKFFISSVIDPLKKERDAIESVISRNHVAIRSEKFIGNEPSRELIQKKIKQCHCYIGIFDKKWGSVPQEKNPENLSITALEYQEAKELGLPVFIIVSRTKKRDKELDSFLKKIGEFGKGENWNRYKDVQELTNVLASYLPELVKQIEKKPVGIQKINEKIIEHNKKYIIIDSLIGGSYEKPPQFDKNYKQIQKNNTWIKGSRGIGKSVFLKKFAEKFQKEKKQVIFFRAEEIIDKRDFQNITKDEFGLALNEFVKKITKTKDLYILIDSVETIARRPEAWHSFSIEIPNLQKNKNIHTILSIRSSDFDAFPNQFKPEWGNEVELSGFSITQVKKLLKKFSVKGKISDDLYEILRTPFYLSILYSLTKKGKTSFSSIKNRYQFLQEHYKQVIRNNERTPELAEKKVALLSKICKKMLTLRQFKIPNSSFPSTPQFTSLRSDGVILDKEDTLEFFHHVYFDYLMSVKIKESRKILNFLKKHGSELFLKSTIFFTLQYYHDVDQNDFAKNVKSILNSNIISFYWKRVLMEFFANLTDVTNKDTETLESLLAKDPSIQGIFLEYLIKQKSIIWYNFWSTTLFSSWSKDANFQHGIQLSNYVAMCLKEKKDD